MGVEGGHTFQDMGAAVSRYGMCCFEIWEVLYWGVEGRHTSRDMGGAVSRYGRCCAGGWRGSYILRYGRGCFEILEVLFQDMGGAEICFGRRENKICRIGGLVVSV